MAGWGVGIREIYDAIRLVSFIQCYLGHIELERTTLQAIDNPFGAKL